MANEDVLPRANVGQVREFDPQICDWPIYKRRLDNYFVANNITDGAVKRAILLNALSEEGYKLIYNLSLPILPESKTFAELVDLFNKHFASSESFFAARSKFYSATKNVGENANEWAARSIVIFRLLKLIGFYGIVSLWASQKVLHKLDYSKKILLARFPM